MANVLKQSVVKGVSLAVRNPRDDTVPNYNEPVQVYHIDSERDLTTNKCLSQYNLNYRFDEHDHRDWKFSMLLAREVDPRSLPPSVYLHDGDDWGPILDQGTLGASGVHTIAYQLRHIARKSKLMQDHTPDFSRLYMYYNARKVSGYSTMYDTGISIRQGLFAIQTQGCVPEAIWPYHTALFHSRPSTRAYDVGALNKGLNYYTIAPDLMHLKKCLHDGYIVSFGMAIFESFMSAQVTRTGIVPIPHVNEKRIGTHAMTLVGYDDSKRTFIVCNSWGSDWGDKGFCYIPYVMVVDPVTSGDFWTVRALSYKLMSSSVILDENLPLHMITPSTVLVPQIDAWQPNVLYKEGERVMYNGLEWKCLITHTSIPQWIPPNMIMMWTNE